MDEVDGLWKMERDGGAEIGGIGNVTPDDRIASSEVTQIGPGRALGARLIGLGTRRGRSARVLPEVRLPAASLRRDSIFRRGLAAADLIAMLGTLWLVTVIASRPLVLTWLAYGSAFLVVVGMKLCGLYDRDEALLRKTTLDEVPRLFQVATVYVLALWLGSGWVARGGFDRHEMLFLWVGIALSMIVARSLARWLALRFTPPERCLFIGDGPTAKTMAGKLAEHRSGVKATLIAQLEMDEAGDWSSETFSEERLSEIRSLATKLDVHRAIIAPRSSDSTEMLDLVRTLKAVGVRVSVLPRLLEAVGSAVEFDDLHGLTVMGVRRFHLTRSSKAIKRVFDLSGAIVGLVAISPLMGALALAIKLDSRGPVFFRQSRVGRDGGRFSVVKFRTMVLDAEAKKDSLRDRNEAEGGMFKIANDPRITRVGSFLRKSSLDELPQLLNILKGEMSLVGPRPLVIEEDEQIEGWQRRRLALTPGMTGHWQILGPTKVPLGEMVAIDYLYVANWTLWSDLKILLRTVPHVLGRNGL